MTSLDTTLICGILPNPPVFWRIILLNTSCVVDVPISIPALKISSVCILLLLQKLFFFVCVCRSPYNCAVVFYLRQPGFYILVQSGISYGINKNPACRILRLRRVALATSFVSAAVRIPGELFYVIGTKFPNYKKKESSRYRGAPLHMSSDI